MPPTRTSDLTELSELLPYLRQLLTCCACAGLLDDAMISLTCGHCYCFECQFREPLLKIPCRQCRERTGLVMESQLQLLVKCYKKMCRILGEELRNNPAILQPEPAPVEVKLEIVEEEIVTDDISKELVAEVKKEPQTPPDEISDLPKNKIPNTTADPNFDPIAEIIQEVEKGIKVSREVFIIKAPVKYRNIKAVAPPKKEPASVTDTSIPKKTPLDEIQTADTADSTASATAVNKASKVTRKLGKNAKKNRKILTKKSLRLTKIATLKKTSKKRVLPEEKRIEKEEIKPKRKIRKTLPVTSPDKTSSPKPLPDRPKRKKTAAVTTGRSKRNVKPLADKATEENSAQPILSSQELKIEPKSPAVESVPSQSDSPISETAAWLSECNEIKVASLPVTLDCLDTSSLDISPATVTLPTEQRPAQVLSEALDQTTLTNWRGAAVKKKSAESKEETRVRKLNPLCPSVVVKRSRAAILQMVVMQRKTAKGKKMRYKIHHRHHHHHHHNQQRHHASANMSTTSASSSSSSKYIPAVHHHPPGTLSPFPRQTQRPLHPASLHHHHHHHHHQHTPPSLPSHPYPPPPPPPPPGDIPLPDDIPILPNDGSQDSLDSEFDWKEFSEYLESNDEDSMSLSLSSASLDEFHHQTQQPRLLPPPMQHRHDPRFNHPVHFEKFSYPPRHVMHPPYMGPPPPPPPPPPGHPHMPHPPHPHQRHGPPHPPMGMPPQFSPLRSDMPPRESFFHHHRVMGPDDFMPNGGRGIIRPPNGGFTGHIPPRGSFGRGMPRSKGPFHRSPGHSAHPQGLHFPPPPPAPPPPMPSPRMGFPSPRPGVFPDTPPAPIVPPPPKPPKPKKKNTTTTPASKKIKTEAPPGTPPPTSKQKKPPVPGSTSPNLQGTPGKKRRSPGYSEAGWRCRCGTNNVMFPDNVCAKGKCPCYTKGIACKNCLCRHCHNPFGVRELNSSSSSSADVSTEVSAPDLSTTDVSNDSTTGTDAASDVGVDTVTDAGPDISMTE